MNSVANSGFIYQPVDMIYILETERDASSEKVEV